MGRYVYTNPKTSIIAFGTYSGNDTANRAIPHLLDIKPKFVEIVSATNGFSFSLITDDFINFQNQTNTYLYAVTPKDATNFYVGNVGSYAGSGNATGYDYNWVALG